MVEAVVEYVPGGLLEKINITKCYNCISKTFKIWTVLFSFQSSYSVNKSLPLLHNTSIVAKAHTGIVQLDCAGDKLLVSTMSKSAVVDLKRFVSQLSIKEKLQMPLFLLLVHHSCCESCKNVNAKIFYGRDCYFVVSRKPIRHGKTKPKTRTLITG